jgi:transketolase
VALALTRQKLPILDRTKFPPAELLLKGAYILADADQGHPRIILIATGSEVHLALEAWGRLADEGIPARVVSMPSWELFDRQPEAYRNEVLPPAVTARLAIEAAVPHGWHRYVGLRGGVIGMTRFGASAPYQVLMQQFGFTAEHVVSRAMELLA